MDRGHGSRPWIVVVGSHCAGHGQQVRNGNLVLEAHKRIGIRTARILDDGGRLLARGWPVAKDILWTGEAGRRDRRMGRDLCATKVLLRWRRGRLCLGNASEGQASRAQGSPRSTPNQRFATSRLLWLTHSGAGRSTDSLNTLGSSRSGQQHLSRDDRHCLKRPWMDKKARATPRDPLQNGKTRPERIQKKLNARHNKRFPRPVHERGGFDYWLCGSFVWV